MRNFSIPKSVKMNISSLKQYAVLLQKQIEMLENTNQNLLMEIKKIQEKDG